MEDLPQDPMMLYSFVNLKLRDRYTSLEDMCDDLSIDIQELCERLVTAGFEYSREHNKFW